MKSQAPQIMVHLFLLYLSLRVGVITAIETLDTDSVFIRCSNATGSFQCGGDERTCISTASVCDGVADCSDGSDETADCLPQCSEGWFRCRNGHCISSSWRCDGHNDCLSGDDSDEENCSEVAQPPASYTCRSGDFRCSDGLCIPGSWHCDGERDCYAGDDEDTGHCRAQTGPKCGERFSCSSGECIDHSWVCDGHGDCEDGSDEVQCLEAGEGCDVEHGRFLCSDNSRCLEAGQVCDGVVQCPDSSDEAGWCSRQESCSALTCSEGCVETRAGPRCYCAPGSSLGQDLTSCHDFDECQVFGSCSQNCVNNKGSFNCSCSPGYVMVNSSCLTSTEPLLIFSTVTEIRALGVRSSRYFPVVSRLPHVVGVGYDHLQSKIYWTDVQAGRESILSAKLSTNFSREDSKVEVSPIQEQVVTSGLDMPEQLTVDVINQNLYFTDPEQHQVGVCSMHGRGCSVLVAGLERPRGVALHQSSSQLVITDWGQAARIIILALDGTNQRDLVTENIVWPNGLAVDQMTDRVYWADSKQDVIECVDLQGQNRRTILTSHPKHPFSLAVFEDTLYWSDWETREIVSCNKFTGKDYKVVMKEAGVKPMGLVIAHPLAQQAQAASPCTVSPLPCSHVCLPSQSAQRYKCACPQQMVLDRSGAMCLDDPAVPRLLLSTSSSFYQVNPHGLGKANLSLVSSILPSKVGKMASLSQGPHIFLSSQGQSGQLLSLNVSSSQVRRLKTAPKVGSVAFDSATGNLYWVDVSRKAINVLSTKTNKNIVALLSHDLPHHLLFVPEKNRLLVAHPGYLALIDIPSKETQTFSNPSLQSVSSMVFSYSQDSVYIGDYTDTAIHKLDLKTGTFSKILSKLTSGVTSLALAGDYLYWTERSLTNLLWAKIENPDDLSWQELSSISYPDDILQVTSFKMSSIPPSSACSTADCTHVCFTTETAGGFQCQCPLGLELESDQKTCRPPPGCSSSSKVFTCNDGQCIPHQFRCDGEADCEAGEDEADCDSLFGRVRDCGNNETRFLCGDGQCIPSSWQCDGDNDCDDGSDEPSSCLPQVCDAGWKDCDDHECILEHWFCDGEADCSDGSDEKFCNITCPGGQILCQDNKLCIQLNWLCDSKVDCHDGSDEANCTSNLAMQCSAEEFQCNNGNCVGADLFCDGDDNCGDNSDEEGQCHRVLETAAPAECEAGLGCGSLCLPLTARCNGTSECPDLSDEANCNPCSASTFPCSSDGRCVPASWRCDGTEDCRDGSDEAGCTKAVTCGSDEFQCNSGDCIQLTAACDEVSDCPDGSDEHTEQCLLACQDNGGCAEECQATPSGPVCRCGPGHQEIWSETGDLVMCQDLDECLLLTSCSQLCTNTKGSYKCSCKPGFTQEHHDCRAQGDLARLLYAVEGKVEGLTVREDSQVRAELEMSSQEISVRSFDFNPRTSKFYWTSPTQGIVGRYDVERRENQVWLEGVEGPDQVGVDWLTGNVYLSHSRSSNLTVCSSKGLCLSLTQAPVIITMLKLDPVAGLMFVAGYHHQQNQPFRTGAVYPYTLAGEPVKEAEIIGSGKTGVPTGLALDMEMRRVYWTDFPSYDINVCDYLGKRCSSVTKTTQDLPNFLTFFESKLYWISAGQESLLIKYDIVRQNMSVAAKLPASSHSLRVIQSSMLTPSQTACSSLSCSGLCLRSGEAATCHCDPASPPCRLLTGQPPPHPTARDNSDVVAKSKTDKLNGGTIALAVILAFAGVTILAVIYNKCKRPFKPSDISLSFTNSIFNQSQPEVDHELSAVEVVRRDREGTTVGYDNPGFQSPWTLSSRPAALDWPDSPQILCSGSSTPAIARQKPQDTDSAFQEPFLEPSVGASSYTELNQRHFSVVDEEEDSPFCGRDQQRLIKKK